MLSNKRVPWRSLLRHGYTLTLLTCCAAVAPIDARDLNGGEVYTSRTKLFRVTAPRADNFAVGRFKVVETSNKKGQDLFEEVAFWIKDFGELYRVGIVRIGLNVRSLVNQPEGDLPATARVFIALFLHYGGVVPGEPKVMRIEEVPTPHGPGVAAMNDVKGGSQLVHLQNPTREELEAAARKGRKVVGKRENASVAVVVVKTGDYLLYASAQNDFLSHENDLDRWQASISTRALGMLQSLTLLRELQK